MKEGSKGVQEVYAVKAKSGKLVEESQSGGAFTVLAENVLAAGGVVYGVCLDDDLRAVYKKIEEDKQLKDIKGSKYVQAYINDMFSVVERDLQNTKKVLFSGTPCQVCGLYGYLKMKNVDVSNLYTCDLICHGVVSPMVFQNYIEHIEKLNDNKRVKSFNFRDKSIAGHKSHLETYTIKEHKMVSLNYANIFYSNLALRESCYICPFATMHRVGDITLGDYWGIENICPQIDDNKGISLVLINSVKGKKLFEEIRDSVVYERTKVEDCVREQGNLQHPTEKPEEYDEFWSLYHQKGFESAVKKYCGYNAEDDWEKLEKDQYIKRLQNKAKRMIDSIKGNKACK